MTAYPRELVDAIQEAGLELAGDPHYWGVADSDSPGAEPEEDGVFVTVVAKHILPLMDPAGWKTSRIAALKAELAVLENES